jgi:two-component system cell cycle response regulator
MPARILLIEDNPANLELMRFLLAAFGHTVETSTTGERGIELAAQRPPDLILCDIQMRGLDGFETLRHLRTLSVLAATPVVAVTALAMVGDREKILASGFDGYLSKPIDPANFLTQAETFLAPGLRNAALVERVESPPRGNAGVPTGKRVMVVDDIEVHLDLATVLLESAGLRVHATTSAREALREARMRPPDLFVSDVVMREGSGFDFIAAVKADPGLRHVPFMFLTSTASNEAERQRGLALGACRYLFRPIEPQDLLSHVLECLGTGPS